MRTVGQLLSETRNSKRYSLQDAEKATKIKRRYLEALESGDWKGLPGPTFIQGFLRNYSLYLGLSPDTVLAMFRREYVLPTDSTLLPKGWVSPLDRPPFVITPRFVVGLSVAAVLLFFFGYLLTQYRFFVGAPVLTVSEPVESSRVSQPVVDVIGQTDPDAALTINGQPVQVTSSGAFAESVTLTQGVNIIRVVSVNKFGKETHVVRTVFVEAAP